MYKSQKHLGPGKGKGNICNLTILSMHTTTHMVYNKIRFQRVSVAVRIALKAALTNKVGYCILSRIIDCNAYL